LKIQDSGLYTCVVSFESNGRKVPEAASTTWAANLFVESPRNPNVAFHRQPDFSTYPSPPSKPLAINYTSSEITVSWRKVTEIGASTLLGYRLEYFDADSPQPTWHVASPHILAEIFTIRNLQPDTR
jgi:roundabout axon guidance receptor 2